MTASPSSPRNSMAANDSPLMFGSSGYAELMRRQFETAIQLTTAWATAMSAMSGAVRAAPSAAVNGASGGASADAPQLTVLPGEGDSTPTANPGPTGRGWLDGADEPHRPRMLDWLTGSPTLHPNLFDEAVVLLVDEDIKTAS